MKIRRGTLLSTIVLLVSVPGAWAGVDVGYDTTVDFSTFHTYGWKENPGEGAWQAPNLMTDRRIYMAVDQELQAKGLTKATGNPDLLIARYVSKSTNERIDSSTYGYIPNTWTAWMSASTTVRETSHGSLVIDLVDPKSNVLVWRGVATTSLGTNPNPEKTGKKVLDFVQKMFKDFPPKDKKK